MEQLYDYDDVLIKPKYQSGGPVSREEVFLNFKYKNLNLSNAFIASPMRGIISPELIIRVSNLGGLGIMHRFYDNVRSKMSDIELISASCKNFGISTNVHWYVSEHVYDCSDLWLIEYAIQNGARVICIDTANGYLSSVHKSIKYLKNVFKKRHYNTLIMSGNVVTFGGAMLLKLAGCDLIRVGIGSGNLCTTRLNTGIGIPQISALQDCSRMGVIKGLISDGGINNPDRAVKSFVAGANAIMLGSALARTYESAHNGIIYGMASRKLQEEYYHSVKSIEGREVSAEKNISLQDLMNDWEWNIRSAGTYIGARNIKEFKKNGRFISIK